MAGLHRLQTLELYRCPKYKPNMNRATSGFELGFAIVSQHFWCRGSQPKHVSNPDSVIKKSKPPFIYDAAFHERYGCADITDMGLACLGDLRLVSLNLSECTSVTDSGQ